MRITLLLCGLLFAPVAAMAHTDGLSFERQADNILIDIGFGKDMPVTGKPVTYSFDLFKVNADDSYAFEPFTDVSARIVFGQKDIAKEVLPNNGTDVPFLTHTFDEAGDYSLAVEYRRAGKEPVNATFGFRVGQSPQPEKILHMNPLAAAIGGVIVLLIIARMILLMRRKD